jgi:hypothetical protein
VAVAKIPFQNDVHKWFNNKLKSNNLFTSSTAFYRCSDFCYKVTKNSQTVQAIRELFFKKNESFFCGSLGLCADLLYLCEIVTDSSMMMIVL